MEQIASGTDLKKLFEEMMDEKFKTAKKEWLAEQAKQNNQAGKVGMTLTKRGGPVREIVKSPSDTTIYKPAVPRINQVIRTPIVNVPNVQNFP